MSTNFRFAPDILRRLGEELNPSVDQGLLELVKNAYDADALECEVTLTRTGRRGGTITVSDDGNGMTVDQLAQSFLIIGSSSKSVRKPTARNRIPAGNKGLGRLAALRLGRKAIVTTRPSPTEENVLEIDWASFDKAEAVEEVPLEIQAWEYTEGEVETGTEIRIEQVRRPIGRMDVKRLARSMIVLADPFGDDPTGFQPRLNAPEFRDLERLVAQRYFAQAEFHLHAELDAKGKSSATVKDWKGDVLYEASHKELAERRKGGVYKAPPCEFDFYVFILSQQVFRLRSVSLAEVRRWLGELGGVYLYINGMRVAPYGNPGDDWLQINRRRAGDPEERPSTNTSIGRIRVVDTRGQLEQKTDRSGVIETNSFAELRAFATDALDWMQRRRLADAEDRRRLERLSAARKPSLRRERLAKEISKHSDEPERTLDLLETYDKEREREASALRREVQLYRTLATAGITAATVAHETEGNPFKVITSATTSLETRLRRALGPEFDPAFARPIELIKRSLSSISSLSTATLRLVEHDKRRAGRIDVHDVIDTLLETYKPFLDNRDVKARTEFDQSSPYLRGSEAAIESIMTNLLNNSLAVFEMAETEAREIVIRTEVEGRRIRIIYGDNGPGIGISLRSIWLPGVSDRPNGTGLGLTIVRDTVSDLSGSVEAIAHGSLGGAEFVVVLPIIGS